MGKPIFTGACTALVTPFLGGKVNYPMMEQLLRRQVDAGISAVVISGTTGESPTLSDTEKITLFHRCKDYVGDSCAIIAGTGTNSTEHAIELSIAAEEAGVDALLMVTPYYNKATPDGLVAHYLSIAHRVNLPIILYNVPTRTGVDIPVSVYQRLSRIPNIVGVKEASSDITKILRIREACGQNFTIWSGNDDQIVPAIACGASGVISVLSNIYPEETQEMCAAALNGDYKTSGELQRELLTLVDLLFCEVNPIPVKAAMKCIGYDCGECRLPLCQLTKEHQKQIEAYFA
ncbi:MAG: 4-hydroxy-tetrahydrodipicolinate synthase [Oscillospiraceae bacterium]|nr:4-hydroxy-tetrahydrodipicolinate synthase [Oscillospiraceae bacterium]